MTRQSLPKLPQLLERKLYKTGQTRGADDDEIYQNRVSRNSTVLIPYPVWADHFTPALRGQRFEHGFIVLISPHEYFNRLQDNTDFAADDLVLGQNALIFYETRSQWTINNPTGLGWKPAENRLSPLGGEYVARVSATTASNNVGEKIVHGFRTTYNKGAGIRVYEYADQETIKECRDQLEAIFWLCGDAHAVAANHGMTPEDAELRKTGILKICEEKGLLDYTRLSEARILSSQGRTICPLCLKELSSQGFFSRMEQAAGREILDLTITQINLFHIKELRMGEYNHRAYNLGWGHHHCNVVVKDTGIRETLQWMAGVLRRNIDEGYLVTTNRGDNGP